MASMHAQLCPADLYERPDPSTHTTPLVAEYDYSLHPDYLSNNSPRELPFNGQLPYRHSCAHKETNSGSDRLFRPHTNMKFWYHDESDEHPTASHDGTGEYLTLQDLNQVGVLGYEQQSMAQVDEIAKERGYVARDEVGTSAATATTSASTAVAAVGQVDGLFC